MLKSVSVDVESLCDEYRELYWFINELQLAGATRTSEYRNAEARSNELVAAIGFVPEA